MSLYLIDFENVRSDGMAGIENLQEQDQVFIFYSEHAGSLTFDMHQRLMQSKAKIYYVEIETGSKNALDFQLVSYLGYMLREQPDIAYRIVSRDRGFEVVAQFWRKRELDVRLSRSIEASGISQASIAQNAEKAAEIPTADDFTAESSVSFSTEQPENTPDNTPENIPASEPELPADEPENTENIAQQPEQQKQESTRKKPAEKSGRKKQNRKNQASKPAQSAPAKNELQQLLEAELPNPEEREYVEKCINELTTKSGINNRIVKKYGTTRAGEIYRIIKPLLKDKKGR